jgi:hypothetical protein
MEVKIEANVDLFEKAKEKLSSSQICRAMQMAINDSLRKGRTMVRKSVQDGYNIKAAKLNDKDPKRGITTKLASVSDLSGQINAGHYPISLKDANPQFTQGTTIAQRVSFKNGAARKGGLIRRSQSQISIEIIKGQRKTLGSAFIPGVGTNASNGQQFATPAIFARGKRGKPGFAFGKDRYPIDVMSTISVATATVNDRSLEKYKGPINDYAQSRFIHHIERLIKQVDGVAE